MICKNIRQKGKLQFKEYFKQLKEGDRVAFIGEPGSDKLKRLVGSVGIVKEQRGRYVLVEMKEGNKTKTFIIHPAYLRIIK